MVNRLEKLERFFGGSRKRDKDREAKNRELSVVSTLDNQHFPSPSFMNPTSIHMKPREEPISWSREAKERSHSLPGPHGNRKRRSSIGSIGDILNHRYHPSDPIHSLSPSAMKVGSPLGTPRLSRFRFPEALTMDEKGITARERTAKDSQEESILNWYPQRVSSLFNNLGLDTSIDDRIAKLPATNGGLSVSKPPSPTLSTPPSPRTRIDTTDVPPRQSSRKPSKALVNEFSLPPRTPPPPFPVPIPDSPPASDSEDECSHALHDRLVPVKALASPIRITPQPSLDFNSRHSSEISRPTRESWGARSQDPVPLANTTFDESAFMIRSRFVRKTGSLDSLSTITKYRPIERDLKEPTLDDFYHLDDDDVLERRPATPKSESEVEIPPTPPPKDSPKTPIGRSRSTRHMPIAPTFAINSSSGELTPPRTPTDSQFLTLAYSPTNASGALGAMWAASIASTYNFDLVYIISLWPKAEGDSSDPSRRSTSTDRRPQSQDRDHAAARCSIVANPKSEVTGRILAAYGLNQFGSPFRIHAQFHKKMLGFKGWKEYRDELASPGMISRGWTCSFYSDHITTAPNEIGDSHIIQNGIANRGIVFAAYTRKTTKSAIPVISTPKQTAILGKLFYDAQTLVDALVHGA
ncbi:uncharacterized protein GGS22DRAFT_12828 [Annulohypoxylon maeteangense]|uniref:uncharacterized protein n=1 Tax=Annulohypoxylon maeteangense TaxID=1927788 RepID=UPI0020074707|nr:uncharacterized protein GGS22DRAFT_12828 [Annulohypoxylon maeteangense]KAI0890382.1 hypothetical protein GGS22DRAFT_12828 [Annulohypoxylon maeteangense]